MINAQLLFEERLSSANVSKSGKYLFISKSSKCSLYDFQSRKHLFDIPAKYVRKSFFSQSEKFIILRCPATFVVFDIESQTVTAKISAGTASETQSIMLNDDFFYLYCNTRTRKKTLYAYNVALGERKTVYKDIDCHVDLFSDGKYVYVIFKDGGSLTIDPVSGHIEKHEFTLKDAAGIVTTAYSKELSKFFYVKKEDDRTDIYSFDILSGESKFVRRTPSNRRDIFFVCAYRHYLFIGRYFTGQLIDMNSENNIAEFDAFPVGILSCCDNNDYFSIFTGEYVSLYRLSK